MQHIVQAEQQRRAKICSVMTVADPAIEIVKDAVIPLFGEPVTFEYPGNIPSVFYRWLISTNIYLETVRVSLLLHIITYPYKGHQCVFRHGGFQHTTERQ